MCKVTTPILNWFFVYLSHCWCTNPDAYPKVHLSRLRSHTHHQTYPKVHLSRLRSHTHHQNEHLS